MATTTLRDALAELHPAADSADNNQIADVIGNKSDTVNGDSIMGYAKSIDVNAERGDDHIHKAAKCYPSLDDGILIIGGLTDWVLGNAVAIVPINTITSPFDIHFIEVELASANDVYELVLYSDAGITEIGRARMMRSAAGGPTSAPFQCEIQAANTGIWAKLASQDGAHNLTISLFYHVY